MSTDPSHQRESYVAVMEEATRAAGNAYTTAQGRARLAGASPDAVEHAAVIAQRRAAWDTLTDAEFGGVHRDVLAAIASLEATIMRAAGDAERDALAAAL